MGDCSDKEDGSMKTTILRMFMILACVVATSAAGAESLMKAGLWETQLIKNVVDGRDVTETMKSAMANMQQMMANMSPQQRKQMEAMMGKDAMNSSTQRVCVSPAMASGDKPVMPSDVKCEPTTYKRNGNKVNFEFSCTDQGRMTTGKVENLLASETMSSKVDLVTTDATGRHTVYMESSMRYIGSDCGGIKPADQVMREAQKK
jgi:hypothetical protein